MKIVNIIGGLGNQMFQYAFAYTLQKRFPDEIVTIDISHYGHLVFKKFRGANLHNGFEIHKVFSNARIQKARPSDLMRLTWYIPNYILSRLFRRILPVRKTEFIQEKNDYFAYNENCYKITGNCYYEGIWGSAKYYSPLREEIRHLYAHGRPNKVNAQLINGMESSESVGIHIRRGDYLSCPEFRGICDLEYYQCAIRKLLEEDKQYTFYIFSNDMKWCEDEIAPMLDGYKVIFVRNNRNNDAYWDMFLMTHCKNLIIANSSFSWWGAFLNKRDGVVIAPKKWVNRDAVFDIWLDDWILL